MQARERDAAWDGKKVAQQSGADGAPGGIGNTFKIHKLVPSESVEETLLGMIGGPRIE